MWSVKWQFKTSRSWFTFALFISENSVVEIFALWMLLANARLSSIYVMCTKASKNYPYSFTLLNVSLPSSLFCLWSPSSTLSLNVLNLIRPITPSWFLRAHLEQGESNSRVFFYFPVTLQQDINICCVCVCVCMGICMCFVCFYLAYT